MSAELRVLLGLVLTGSTLLLFNCGGNITAPPSTGGFAPDGGKHDASSADAAEDAPFDAGHPLPGFVDSGCPEAGPHTTSFVCDPFNAASNGCSGSEGCYIYAQNPTNVPSGCGQEEYGSLCAPAGSAGPGQRCNGATDCLGGHSCVVSGEGTQCVKLCPLSGDAGCAGGRTCMPIDVQGFGGCL